MPGLGGGDAFQWANTDTHTEAGGLTITTSSSTTPIQTVGLGVITINPATDAFDWPPAQNNTPAPDTHTAVVDTTTVHDTVAAILPDAHTVATVGLGGYS